jgi:hypothetical protein
VRCVPIDLVGEGVRDEVRWRDSARANRHQLSVFDITDERLTSRGTPRQSPFACRLARRIRANR